MSVESTLTPVADPARSDADGGLRIWVNGQLYDAADQAHVSAIDHGLIVGDGVFEALKVTDQGPFALGRHLRRLNRSASAMGLAAPDHSQIRAGVAAVLEHRRWTYGKVRITYTAGRGPLGSRAAYGPVTVVVAAQPIELEPPTSRVVTAPWTRNEKGALAGVKSTSYAENVRALGYATAREASEAIFTNTGGHVCEGTGSNLFCVFGSTVVTPPLSAGPLAGITRELLLEWSEVSEDNVTPAEALNADEIFLTSSTRDVQAVIRWDGRTFDGPGPTTTALAELFAHRSRESVEP